MSQTLTVRLYHDETPEFFGDSFTSLGPPEEMSLGDDRVELYFSDSVSTLVTSNVNHNSLCDDSCRTLVTSNARRSSISRKYLPPGDEGDQDFVPSSPEQSDLDDTLHKCRWEAVAPAPSSKGKCGAPLRLPTRFKSPGAVENVDAPKKPMRSVSALSSVRRPSLLPCGSKKTARSLPKLPERLDYSLSA